MSRPERVLVAMSGGVDSSVAAALLVQSGHEVVGVTMKTFCYSETPGASRSCCGLDGITDARRVADHLGISHYVFDVEEDFTRDVIDDFVTEYAEGRTPNPCVRCNSNTKFRDLMRRGALLGCDAIASGHYVRVEHFPEGSPRLRRGADADKDQAYFLWGLPPELLPALRFPLGDLTKPEVRERARALGLTTAEKPESQEICFVPTGSYTDLLGRRLGTSHPALSPGAVVLADGTQVGEHRGYAGFTVGQRRGIGGGFQEPMYVLEVRADSKEVVIGRREELLSAGLEALQVNWLTAEPPRPGARVGVQIRHRAPAVSAVVEEFASGGAGSARREPWAGGHDGERLRLRFTEPVSAVTPGQSAVFFDGDVLLGGGRISRPIREGEWPAALDVGADRSS